MNNAPIASNHVRQFLVTRYAEQIQGKGISAAEVPDSFDFLLEGIVDSLGILELVGALEREFSMELDMAGLDAEQLTVLGPLAHYVAEQASARQNGRSSAQSPG